LAPEAISADESRKIKIKLVFFIVLSPCCELKWMKLQSDEADFSNIETAFGF
jgi:hypothetical protein